MIMKKQSSDEAHHLIMILTSAIHLFVQNIYASS